MTTMIPRNPNSLGVPKISYKEVEIGKIRLIREASDLKDDEVGSTPASRRITRLIVDGDELRSSQRFLTSMCAIYGFAPSIFSYFTPDEVLSRIMEVRSSSTKVRLAIEHDPITKQGMALGVSKPNKPHLSLDGLTKVLKVFGVKLEDCEYHDGQVISWHTPRLDAGFKVFGDAFHGRFVVQTPIDGYGVPSAFLSLIREVCCNGVVANSKVFRSQVRLGKDDADVAKTMTRFIDSFSNEEGFAALRQRFESARTSPASLDEYFSLFTLLHDDAMLGLHRDENGKRCQPFASQVTDKMRKLCGSLEVYGLTSFDSLTQKKRRTIPTSARLYDMINLATELATHYATPMQSRKLSTWVGTTISNEFDLEGTLSENEDPVDLFFGKILTAPATFGNFTGRSLDV